MAWKPKSDTVANWSPPPGVGPWRDLTEDEYEALGDPSLARFFDHVDDGASSRKARPQKGD